MKKSLFALFFTALTLGAPLFAGIEETKTEEPLRRFAKWSECYKGTAEVLNSENKKEERNFYLLVEATDNLPFIYKNSKGKSSTSGYAFYLTSALKVSEELGAASREVLLSTAHSEKVLKNIKDSKVYAFVHQGEKVEINVTANTVKLNAKKLSVNLEVFDDSELENADETKVPFFSDLHVELSMLADISLCLK